MESCAGVLKHEFKGTDYCRAGYFQITFLLFAMSHLTNIYNMLTAVYQRNIFSYF